jgi:biopolymer transport protein ExbD
MARRDHRRIDDQFVLNLTPLLDVVLQLITFFMMLIHFGTQIEGAEFPVRLPLAASAMPGGDLGLERLVVGIDAKGRLLSDEGKFAREGAAADLWWKDEAAKRRAGQKLLGGPADELPTLVVIRADRQAPYGVVRRAMAAAQRVGFARFTLVVLRDLAQ